MTTRSFESITIFSDPSWFRCTWERNLYRDAAETLGGLLFSSFANLIFPWACISLARSYFILNHPSKRDSEQFRWKSNGIVSPCVRMRDRDRDSKRAREIGERRRGRDRMVALNVASYFTVIGTKPKYRNTERECERDTGIRSASRAHGACKWD